MTHAPARLHRRAARPRRPFRRRGALLGTLALPAFQIACETPPADEADAGEDVLWVGAVEASGGTAWLTPIARLDEGAWSQAWPEPVYDLLIEVPVDSAGLVQRHAAMTALPLDPGGPGAPRIASPHRWLHYPRLVADAAVRSPEPVAAVVVGLALSDAYCGMRWKLRVRSSRGGDDPPEAAARDLNEGVSVNQRPDEVLQASDVAGLDEIAARLGFESRTGFGVGESYQDFSWMGLFRFGSTVLGVVDSRRYEGASYAVVEIDGERSRIVGRLHRGGC